MANQSDANSLQRITIQITKHQHEMLKHYARPGTSVSSMIRRAIDDMFQPIREQALEDAKYEKWEKEAIANKEITQFDKNSAVLCLFLNSSKFI